MLSFNFFSSSNKTHDDELFQTYVHPCVINDTPHIVYPRGLSSESPQLFKQLTQYFSRLGYQLKEDQRSAYDKPVSGSKRRAWAPVLLFSAAVMFESNAMADVEIEIKDKASLQQQSIELSLLSTNNTRHQIRNSLNLNTELEDIVIPSLKNRTADVLFDILKSRYHQQNNDPQHVIEDLELMAEYFSRFPEVVSLFKAINESNWTLVYDENNWSTIASGNAFNVDKAEVHFNSRSAAQLRLNDSCKDNPVCIASPADALLHELLHVNSMFNDSEKFLSQGGMNGVMYPYQHERNVIKQERQLYKSMSATDNTKRPHRHSHHGRIVKANCSTCIK